MRASVTTQYTVAKLCVEIRYVDREWCHLHVEITRDQPILDSTSEQQTMVIGEFREVKIVGPCDQKTCRQDSQPGCIGWMIPLGSHLLVTIEAAPGFKEATAQSA